MTGGPCKKYHHEVVEADFAVTVEVLNTNHTLSVARHAAAGVKIVVSGGTDNFR